MVVWCAGSCGIGWLLRVTLSVLGLSGPATDCFSRNAEKSRLGWGWLGPFSTLFDQKHVQTPPSHEQTERIDLQTQPVLSETLHEQWPIGDCRLQAASCAFSTLWVICGPAAVIFCFSSLSSVEWHFHLSNWAEPSTQQAGWRHMQRCDIHLTAWGIRSEKQTAHSPGDLTQAYPMNIHTYVHTLLHTCTFKPSSDSQKAFQVSKQNITK